MKKAFLVEFFCLTLSKETTTKIFIVNHGFHVSARLQKVITGWCRWTLYLKVTYTRLFNSIQKHFKYHIVYFKKHTYVQNA